MNYTALLAALQNKHQQARLYAAFRLTAIGKAKRHSVSLFSRRTGKAFLKVSWDKIMGFTITDMFGNNVTRDVYSIIRSI